MTLSKTVLPSLQEVDDLVKLIATPDLSFEDLHLYITRLESLIFELDNENQATVNAYYDNLPPEVVRATNDNYCRWETILETRFSEALLRGEATSLNEYFLYERFTNLVSKELAILEEHPFESILFVGSGPFPITAILLHLFTKKPVDCLEREESAAVISRSILRQMGLEDKIRVYVGDGCTFDVSRYDVVLKALLAKPKLGILNNIMCHNADAMILCRTSFGLRQLVYEGTPSTALRGFTKLNKQLARHNDTISTLLLQNRKKFTDSLTMRWIPELDDETADRLVAMMNSVIRNDNNNGFLSLMDRSHPYMQVLERDVRLGLKHLLVIESGNRYLGQLILNHSHLDTYKHRAEVSTLMLDESIRGREVSVLVAESLIGKCDELGVRYLTLDVRAGSKVELLWKYLGFETYGLLPCYSEVGEHKYQGTFMYKDLGSLKESLLRKVNSLYK